MTRRLLCLVFLFSACAKWNQKAQVGTNSHVVQCIAAHGGGSGSTPGASGGGQGGGVLGEQEASAGDGSTVVQIQEAGGGCPPGYAPKNSPGSGSGSGSGSSSAAPE